MTNKTKPPVARHYDHHHARVALSIRQVKERQAERMRVVVLAAVLFLSTIGLMHSAVAQPTSQESERLQTRSGDQEDILGQRAGMPELSSKSMSQMMRGPESAELYPTMIRISEPDLVERPRLNQRAEQWIAEGISSLSEGSVALSHPFGKRT